MASEAFDEVDIVVYGTRWCGATQMVRRHLDRIGVPYRYVDIEESPLGEAELRWLAGGYAKHPTVCVNGYVLIEPSLPELGTALEEAGVA